MVITPTIIPVTVIFYIQLHITGTSSILVHNDFRRALTIGSDSCGTWIYNSLDIEASTLYFFCRVKHQLFSEKLA